MRVERISDPFIKVERSLEGFDSDRSYWTSGVLTSNPSTEQWNTIEAFKFRVRELNENLEDLRLPKFQQFNMTRRGNGAHAHAMGYPQKHRAKSLFLDFRHFLSDKEPAKFEKVCNVLQQLINNKDADAFLRSMRKNWLKCDWQNTHLISEDITAKLLFNIWFNTQYFHAGRTDQNVAKQRILEKYDDDTVRTLLLMSIVEARKYLNWVYCVLKDIDQTYELKYNLPDKKIIYRKS